MPNLPDCEHRNGDECSCYRISTRWCELCVSKPKYQLLWEQGRGPGQTWDTSKPSRGLGDTIAKLTRKIGIKPCGGCTQRQTVLNRAVPYHR
jgi:hypothetical protein